MKKLLSIIIMMAALTSCVPVVLLAGGAVIASTAILRDNRPMKTILKDRDICYLAQTRINNNRALREQAHVVVATYDGIVLLAGQTPTPLLRTRAYNLVKTVPRIKRIYNQITIGAPSSELTRSSDSWITTKIKTILMANPKTKSAQMKIVTENGIVYLMGLTSRKQANLAANIARKISGVQKVIKIFVYTR